MKIISNIICVFLAMFFFNFVHAEGLNDKINKLDEASKTILGVSLRAVSELMQLEYHPRVVRLDYFKNSGKFQYIEELKNKGYVTYEIVKATPEGSFKEVELLMIKHPERESEFYEPNYSN